MLSAWLPIHHLDHNILKNISLSAFGPRVLFSVLLKPAACSQYSGTFCRYRILPCSEHQRGSEGFGLILLYAVVCDHSLDRVPLGTVSRGAWFPKDGAPSHPRAGPCWGIGSHCPAPCSLLLPTLALPFALIFSGSGSLSQPWTHQCFHPSTHTLLFT